MPKLRFLVRENCYKARIDFLISFLLNDLLVSKKEQGSHPVPFLTASLSLRSNLNVHRRVMLAVDLCKNRATESSVAVMCLDAVEATAHMPNVPCIVPYGEFHLIVTVPPL